MRYLALGALLVLSQFLFEVHAEDAAPPAKEADAKAQAGKSKTGSQTQPLPEVEMPTLSAPSGFWSTVFGHAHSKKNQELAEENAKLFQDLTASGGIVWTAFSNNAAFELQVMDARDALEDKIGESDFARLITTSDWEHFALETYRRAGIEAPTVQLAMQEFNSRLAVRLEALRMSGEVYSALIQGHAVLQASVQKDLARYSSFLKSLGTNGLPTLEPYNKDDYSPVGILGFFHSMSVAGRKLQESSGVLSSNNFPELAQLQNSLKERSDSSAVLLLAPVASSSLDSNSLALLTAHIDAMSKVVISNYAVTFCDKSPAAPLPTNWLTVIPALKAFSNACRVVISNYPVSYLQLDRDKGPCGIRDGFGEHSGVRTPLQALFFNDDKPEDQTLRLSVARAEMSFSSPTERNANGGSSSKDIQQLLIRLTEITGQLRANSQQLSQELSSTLEATSSLLIGVTNSFGTNGWQYTNVVALVTNILANTNLFDASLAEKINSPLIKQAYAQKAAGLVESFAKDSVEQQLAQRKLLLEFFREIATQRVGAIQEENRHLEALVSILALETQRWSTIAWLHERYKEEFFYYSELLNQKRVASQADITDFISQGSTRSPRPFMGLGAPGPAISKTKFETALKSALTPAVTGLESKVAAHPESAPHLFVQPGDDKYGVISKKDLVWPSLRVLSSRARDQIQKGVSSDPSGKEMIAAHDRLTRSVKLVQGYFLIDTYNRRYGQANVRLMFKEVRQHELQSAALESRSLEPEIRLLLGDQVLFHKAGWNESYTRQTLGIVEAGILTWIGAKQ